MHRIRSAAAVALLALFVAACESTASPTSTTTDVLPPPEPIGSTSTSTSLPVTTTAPHSGGPSEYRGVLPDGTEYRVFVEGVVGERIEFIDAPIVLGVQAIGIATFPAGDTELGYSYEDGVYRIPAGGAVYIDFYDHILGELGAEAEETIRSSITGTTRFDAFPVLDVEAPFRWAEDFELPAAMEVRYRSFTVRRGCGDLAAACSPTRAVQVIPIDTQMLPIEAWENLDVYVDSPAPRPTSDPYYLDPGPLDARNSAAVIWTGEEMVVWGGSDGQDVPTRTDGAAFNPETNEWRMLEPFPRVESFGARAIWGDDEMLVVSSEGTFGYLPESDSWREIGQALVPPVFNDRMVYLDGSVYVWDRAFSMHRMDVDVGVWETIAAPDEIAGMSEGWSGVLRTFNDRVVAVTVPEPCRGKGFWGLEGDEWGPLPEVSLASTEYADCSSATQTAAIDDSIVTWDAFYTLAKRFLTAAADWVDIPPIPLDGTEGASSPVPMDEARFMVPRWGEGAIFDARTEQWTGIALPGHGTGAEIIWTGEEFLAWGVHGTFDAWRFPLPSGLAGGDDTS